MIELKQNSLVFSFPEIHPKAQCTIEFQRTLRLPDDNQEYPLPPELGQFPLMHVDDLGDKLPAAWEQRGGVLLPMYQSEAMWINFSTDYPFAIKVAAGKINAVTGDAWSNELHTDPQDYLMIPKQSWLDGFCIAKGKIRQFVAMPLGDGYTAEEQLTGAAEHGGIQIIAYPMKLEAYKELILDRMNVVKFSRCSKERVDKSSVEMGLAPGGLMRQEIYEDHYGIPTWDTNAYSRCYVHAVNSLAYRSLTGDNPPGNIPSAKDYAEAGLPWFDYYDDSASALPGHKTLAGLDSVAAMGIKKDENPLPEKESVKPVSVKNLGADKVRKGKF